MFFISMKLCFFTPQNVSFFYQQRSTKILLRNVHKERFDQSNSIVVNFNITLANKITIKILIINFSLLACIDMRALDLILLLQILINYEYVLSELKFFSIYLNINLIMC